MHGRARSEYKAMQRDPKVAAKLAQKAAQWYTLTAQITHENALPLTEKLLTVNPDPLYLWNQRREQFTVSSADAEEGATKLEKGESHDPTKTSPPPVLCDWETESRLTATALQNNPKAYGAWFHRKWCLVQLKLPPSILQQELLLTVQFLDRDERNFHCWNYRRFVISALLQNQQQNQEPDSSTESSGAGAWNVLVEDTQDRKLLMGNQMAEWKATTMTVNNKNSNDDTATKNDTIDWIQHEWDFTNQKIQQNFSNFSAFHYRSKLYELVQPSLTDELSVVENAIFTEPDDQTAWWYQSFLLRQTSNENSENKQAWQDHVTNLRELLDEVPNSKWVVLGLLNCGMQQNVLPKEEQLALCRTLQEIDADRQGRYANLEKQILEK